MESLSSFYENSDKENIFEVNVEYPKELQKRQLSTISVSEKKNECAIL